MSAGLCLHPRGVSHNSEGHDEKERIRRPTGHVSKDVISMIETDMDDGDLEGQEVAEVLAKSADQNVSVISRILRLLQYFERFRTIFHFWFS